MRKLFDTISIFSIIMIASIILDFFFNQADASVLSYDIFFKYAIIIALAMLIFEGTQCLPFRNPVAIYIIASALISLETIVLECLIWDWLEPTLLNICLLSLWVFIVCGLITVSFIRKNIADAKLINKQLEKWKSAP